MNEPWGIISTPGGRGEVKVEVVNIDARLNGSGRWSHVEVKIVTNCRRQTAGSRNHHEIRTTSSSSRDCHLTHPRSPCFCCCGCEAFMEMLSIRMFDLLSTRQAAIEICSLRKAESRFFFRVVNLLVLSTALRGKMYPRLMNLRTIYHEPYLYFAKSLK